MNHIFGIVIITIIVLIILISVFHIACRQNFSSVYKLPILGKLYDLKKLTVPVPEEQSSEEQSSEEQSSEEQSSEEQSSEEQGEQLLINLYKYKTINLTFPKLNLVNAGVTKHTKEKEKTIQRIMNDLSNGT